MPLHKRSGLKAGKKEESAAEAALSSKGVISRTLLVSELPLIPVHIPTKHLI